MSADGAADLVTTERDGCVVADPFVAAGNDALASGLIKNRSSGSLQFWIFTVSRQTNTVCRFLLQPVFDHAACKTRLLQPKTKHMEQSVNPLSIIRGACGHDCPDTCAWQVEVRDGKAERMYGDPNHPFTRGTLCAKVNHYQIGRAHV